MKYLGILNDVHEIAFAINLIKLKQYCYYLTIPVRYKEKL